MMVNIPFVPKDTTGVHRFRDRDYSGFKGPQRNLILWQCPHVGSDRYIEMYINPQGLTYSHKKTITSKRTKGGFLNQYWGEELEVVNIQGTTGDGGVEAVYALLDVYRSEQLAMTEIIQRAFAGSGENLVKRRQPIGPLSTSVTMWYMGEGKRGYFQDFQIEENVQKNGSFDYRTTFVVVDTVNRRQNFMPWHRKPWSTTENPNISSNGRLLMTGGYPGDTRTRIGRLNSPVGYERFVRVEDSATGETQTRRTWVQSPMFDPKYWKDKGIINSVLFPDQGKESIQASARASVSTTSATVVGEAGADVAAVGAAGEGATVGATAGATADAARATRDKEALAESAAAGADTAAPTPVTTEVGSGTVPEGESDKAAEERALTEGKTEVTDTAPKDPAEAEVKRVLGAYDKNNNGKLDPDEARARATDRANGTGIYAPGAVPNATSGDISGATPTAAGEAATRKEEARAPTPPAADTGAAADTAAGAETGTGTSDVLAYYDKNKNNNLDADEARARATDRANGTGFYAPGVTPPARTTIAVSEETTPPAEPTPSGLRPPAVVEAEQPKSTAPATTTPSEPPKPPASTRAPAPPTKPRTAADFAEAAARAAADPSTIPPATPLEYRGLKPTPTEAPRTQEEATKLLRTRVNDLEDAKADVDPAREAMRNAARREGPRVSKSARQTPDSFARRAVRDSQYDLVDQRYEPETHEAAAAYLNRKRAAEQARLDANAAADFARQFQKR